MNTKELVEEHAALLHELNVASMPEADEDLGEWDKKISQIYKRLNDIEWILLQNEQS